MLYDWLSGSQISKERTAFIFKVQEVLQNKGDVNGGESKVINYTVLNILMFI
jgi:hypothetical protein